ncbi:hypothetical protein MUN81_13115 [Hymenobacter sp. 5317J-9]|uniref:hypothetical protein n=1 Tax=Hymenobacter sp. 5317J-9 TaxID=2932250 RepID=UPI001FD63603|nr:hypothetical protein [Hymenobacter sp. 5317J-9]UOQ96192.1 hypothetical protein MUN81_13115 [Hymenobacter sp. 5317J-9]
MKLSVRLLLGLCLAGASAHAQTSNIVNMPVTQRDYSKEGTNDYANLSNLTNGATHLLTRRTNTIGSPYADNRWLTAHVTLANKQALLPMLLKYDVLDRALLMRKAAPSQDSVELNDSKVASFVLDEPASALGPARQRRFRRFEEGPAARQRDYVEVLHEGRYALLKHYLKEIKREGFGGMYSNGAPTDEIEDASVYFLRSPEGTLTPVKLTLKALQTAAPALAEPLKAAAAAQKPRSEAGWGAVLDAADPAAK